MCILVKQEYIEKIREDYRAVYKCRHCGKLFETNNCIPPNAYPAPSGTLYWPHLCKDKVYGCGDFQFAYSMSGDKGWEEDFGNKPYQPKGE